MRRRRSRVTTLAALALLVALAVVWWQAHEGPVEGAMPVGGDPELAIVDLQVPELGVQEREGAALFDAHCAACHGPAGAGQRDAGPPLVHPVYEPDHHPDGAFYAAVQLGVTQHHWGFGDMPRIEGLDEAQIGAIITYVRAVQRRNGIF